MELFSRIIEVIIPPSKGLLQEKRSSPRIRCAIDAAFYKSEDSALTGKIVEVGVTGMRLESAKALHRGEKIGIRVLKGQGLHTITKFEVDKVTVEVRWCKKKPDDKVFYIGVKYCETEENIGKSWVTFLLNKFGFNAGSSFQKRKDVRASSKLPIQYELKNSWQKGIAQNIGLGGMLLAGLNEVPMHEELKIRIGPYGKLASLLLLGKVVRKKYSSYNKVWLTGISFIALSGQEAKLLGDYVVIVLKESVKEPPK
ncbi:MAG: PilZ domain-containing protein [Candidatus Eremiobacteraeota bacterium]|nr:PilZ domain-containing protein [Candidatus Eremiobacteraeota bacterium]